MYLSVYPTLKSTTGSTVEDISTFGEFVQASLMGRGRSSKIQEIWN
jgi:hypothetical protein